MVNRIIATYLKTGRRLVVPQFGAFIHKEGDGTIVFVAFLKKDDGVLTDLLKKEYGVGADEANAIISEFVSQIREGVESRGRFVIDGLGCMKADANGIYYLDYDPSLTAEAGSAPVSKPTVPSAEKTQFPVSEPQTATSQPEVSSQTGKTAEAPVVPEQAVRPAVPVNPPQPPRPQVHIPSPVREQTPVSPQPVRPAQNTVSGEPRVTGNQTPQPAGTVYGSQPAASQSYAQQRMQQNQRPAQPASPVQPRPSVEPKPSVPVSDQSRRPGMAPAEAPYGSRPVPPAPGGMPRGNARPMNSQPGGRGPVRPGRPVPPRAPQQKADRFIIIAILAALVALAAIIFGLLSPTKEPDLKMIQMPVKEAPADSLPASDQQ